MDAFVDRGADIAALQERYDTDEPSLITVWGRRRVRKTELVEHFIRDRDDVVYRRSRPSASELGPEAVNFRSLRVSTEN